MLWLQQVQTSVVGENQFDLNNFHIACSQETQGGPLTQEYTALPPSAMFVQDICQ